jgi:hypothetical protein
VHIYIVGPESWTLTEAPRFPVSLPLETSSQSSTLITPSGTYTLVLTPSAMTAAGKPLQLAPIQLTLVVN